MQSENCTEIGKYFSDKNYTVCFGVLLLIGFHTLLLFSFRPLQRLPEKERKSCTKT